MLLKSIQADMNIVFQKSILLLILKVIPSSGHWCFDCIINNSTTDKSTTSDCRSYAAALLEVISARIDFDINNKMQEMSGGIFMYIAMIFILVQYFKISSLDSLSTTELDIGGQSKVLRVSPSQVLTSPQDLPGVF